MTVLQQLRANPEAAIVNNDFFLDVRGATTTEDPEHERCRIGGKVSITESDKNGITRLTLAPGGTDYYFPWVNRGVGEVTIPINQPDGTVVVTGGMNGCALQVNRDGASLIFYHDGDSKYLGRLKQPKGNELCRIEPDLYMKVPYGETLAKQIGGGAAYLYQMIFVRHAGKWKVMYSGIIIGPGLEMPVIRSFTPGVSKFLASFDE